MLTDRVGLDLEVEVDTDLLEERVVHRDEPHLDGDLKVLKPSELAQQVGDLFVHLGSVLDDQADAEEERHDRTRLPHVVDAALVAAEPTAHPEGRRNLVAVAVLNVPGAGSDRSRDQLHDRHQVDHRPFALGRPDDPASEFAKRGSPAANAPGV